MKEFRFKKIDAFTTGTAGGNPAGCIYLKQEEDITPTEMQKIARELKGYVNEVGFLFPLAEGFRLKYYSSECEVAFCGHATIAILHNLISENEDLRKLPQLTLQVNAGKLSVFNYIQEENAVYVLAPRPQFLPCTLQPPAIARALCIEEKHLDAEAPLQIINAGLRTLIVPLASLDACLQVYPEPEPLHRFCIDNEIDIVLVFSKETALPDSQYRTRVFAVRFGYLEDPATGSGNSAFGHYLLQQNRCPAQITLEQGPSKDNPNIVKLRRYSAGQEERILFGGGSLVRIKGNYLLHE